jgi:hypothetical protein
MDAINWRGVFAWCRRLFLGKRDSRAGQSFITALQWISPINAIAAICATMAAVCAAYSFVKTELGLKAKGDDLRIPQAINHHFYYHHDRGDCPHG